MRVLHWIPALLLAGLIFFLSSQSDPPGARLAPDYLLHSWGYALFGASLVWGLTAGLRERLTRSSLLLVPPMRSTSPLCRVGTRAGSI